jgi:Flp pilus assembly protein TadD
LLDRRVLAWFDRPECDLSSLDAGAQRDSGFGNLSSLLVRCGKPLAAIPILARQRPHLVFDRHYEWYLNALTNLSLCLATWPDPVIRARAVALAHENVEFMSRTNARTWLLLGIALEQTGDLPGADDAFRRGIELGGDDSGTLNGIAWLLVSDPRLASVRPSWALRMGKRAVRLNPQAAHVWNTLGVAHYRAGDWEAAIETLEKAEGLAPGKDFAFKAFFLAMAHWQKGERDEARSWYDKAVSGTETNRKLDEQLRRFRSEAAALLRLSGPSAPAQEGRPRP